MKKAVQQLLGMAVLASVFEGSTDYSFDRSKGKRAINGKFEGDPKPTRKRIKPKHLRKPKKQKNKAQYSRKSQQNS